jgi:hypothetical protein
MLTDWLRDHAVADDFGDFEKLIETSLNKNFIEKVENTRIDDYFLDHLLI